MSMSILTPRKLSERKRTELRFGATAQELEALAGALQQQNKINALLRQSVLQLEINVDVVLSALQDVVRSLPWWRRGKFNADYITRLRKERAEYRWGLAASSSLAETFRHLYSVNVAARKALGEGEEQTNGGDAG